MAALPSVMPTCPPTFHNTIDVRSSAVAPTAAVHNSTVRSETRMITDLAAILRRQGITTCREKPVCRPVGLLSWSVAYGVISALRPLRLGPPATLFAGVQGSREYK